MQGRTTRTTTELAARIRSARMAIGLSQRGLAARTGVSAGAVAQWELGTSSPNTEHLAKLADIFRTSVDWLLDKPAVQPRPKSDEALLAEARALGIDLAQIVAEARARRWLDENKGALDDANAFVARHGLWSDGKRLF